MQHPAFPESMGEPHGDRPNTSHRRRAAHELALKVLEARDRGEALADEQLIAAHPELRPELAEELESARQVRLAFLSAQMAGAIRKPIKVLHDDELEAPIEF